jgi:hypothetical protein
MDLNPLGGITPLEMQILYITMGASKPIECGELGFMVSSLFKFKISPNIFKPRYLRLCRKNLITIEDWRQMDVHLKMRKTVVTPRGVEILRDLGILFGGDYSYYRYLNPFENYASHPERLDRFLPRRHKMGDVQMTKDKYRRQLDEKLRRQASYRRF